MSRYRSYGNARGARTYLSSREEFTMSEDEKNAAFERRRKAAASASAAALTAPKVASTSLFQSVWPSPMSIMRFEAHGTPIPPPPEGYTGPIPDKYAPHIAWPASVDATTEADEGEEIEETEAPGM